MSTYHYSPELKFEEISKKLHVGDNLMGLPYLQFTKFLGVIQQTRPNIDYLYEGKNFIIFSV
jgi:hypothetical protein